MFSHPFYYQCETGMVLLEIKIMFILWTEMNSSVWETSEQDTYKRKFLFFFLSFFFGNAALKISDRKKEKHLHWFWLFNTQEWKSVKSQSLYHHKNAVSLQVTKTQAACSLIQLTSTTQFQHSYRLFKHLLFTNSQYRVLDLSHIFLDLIPRPVVYTFRKECPHSWSISAYKYIVFTPQISNYYFKSFFPNPNSIKILFCI